MDKAEADRMKTLLCEAVSTLCRSGMRYTNAMRVEGLIAITVDEKDILVVNVNKTYRNAAETPEESAEEIENRSLRNSKKRYFTDEDENSFDEEDITRPQENETEHMPKRIRRRTSIEKSKSNPRTHSTPDQCIKIEIDTDSGGEDTKERLSLDDNSEMLGFDGSEQIHLEQVQNISTGNVSGADYDNAYNQPGPSSVSFTEGALPIQGNQTDFSFAFPSSGGTQVCTFSYCCCLWIKHVQGSLSCCSCQVTIPLVSQLYLKFKYC